MTTKSKAKPARKPARRRPKAKKKKSNGFTWGRLVLLLVFMGLAAGAGYVALNYERYFYRGLQVEWVESVVMAAGIDLDANRQVAKRDGVERWKIRMPDRETKNRVVAALKRGVESQNGVWRPGEETWRDGRNYHLVELEKADGTPLRLIFEVVPKKRKTSPKPDSRVAEKKPIDVPIPAPPSAPEERAAPRISIILDDIGHYPVNHLDLVLELKFPITFAVLPYLAHTKTNAISLHQSRYEVILHMPMEPGNFPKTNPGKGAILSHMTEKEIRTAVRNALNSVPFVVGVNNHMGSKITANRTLMAPILDEVKSRDLYFIDSRTSPRTVAYGMAGERDMRTAKRNVFIDAEATYEFAVKQLRETREVARREGSAIAIGHPYPGTLQALAEEMPKMDREGFRFVFASQLVRPTEHL
ncbi:MAG: divergent polysaccharide deacetylase family protein [Acidobacteriota bacterium]|nr:divergent polysaccharide deacetylase family protein [Acidobacteriota bacterium]